MVLLFARKHNIRCIEVFGDSKKADGSRRVERKSKVPDLEF